MPTYPIHIETYNLGSYWLDYDGTVSGDAIAEVSGLVQNGYTYTAVDDETSRNLFIHIPPVEIRRVKAFVS